MPSQPKLFTLSNVVIGCSNEVLVESLKKVFDQISVTLPSKQNYEQQDHNYVFELHQPVCKKLLKDAEADIGISGNAMIEYTAPFMKGCITLETELVILLRPEVTKESSQEIVVRPPPEQSACIRGKPSKLDNEPVKIVDESCSEYRDIIGTIDQTILLSSDFIMGTGISKDEFVQLKLAGEQYTKTHILKVHVVEKTGIPGVQLSAMALFNLGASEMDEDICVTITPLPKYVKYPLSSTSYDQPPVAKEILVAKVYLSDNKYPDLPKMDSLQQFFIHERYMSPGDMFALKITNYSDATNETVVVMKVKEIKPQDTSSETYKVTLNETAHKLAGPVQSFIPAHLIHKDVKVGCALKSLRDELIHLLQAFNHHKWHPNPIPFVILCGPEGCGKSVVVKQLAKVFQCNFVEANCVNMVADTVSGTELRVKDILQQANSVAPVVLLLKNIDMLTKEEAAKSENPRVAQYFHSQLVDFLKKSEWPIFVFGTCNKLMGVNEEIRELTLREIVLQAPSVKERLNILGELSERLFLSPEVSLEYLADHTAGFLYEDLKALISHAERNALIRGYGISKEELGEICEDSLNEAKILVNDDDFKRGLESIQSVQSVDLGAPQIPNVTWSDIGGLQKVKEDILDTIQLPLKHPELFISAMRRSGVLLYGPPGTGKTLLAKAVATECALNFFSVKGPELINMYVGQSEENVRQVFQKARGASPCVIFFDELDSLAPNRGKSGDSGGVMDRVVSQLLAELDGLNKSRDVFVIGATNRPDLLDPALLRPGRFDKLVYVGISSTPSERLTILEAITRKFDVEEGINLQHISEKCPENMTGADLYSLCAEAVTNAIKRQIDAVNNGKPIEQCNTQVTLEDFVKAVDQATPSLSNEEIKRYDDVRKQFALIDENENTDGEKAKESKESKSEEKKEEAEDDENDTEREIRKGAQDNVNTCEGEGMELDDPEIKEDGSEKKWVKGGT